MRFLAACPHSCCFNFLIHLPIFQEQYSVFMVQTEDFLSLYFISTIEIYSSFYSSEVGTVFSLSWLITWFGHVLDDIRHIVRLYDFFIASHNLMPIYLAAAVSTSYLYEFTTYINDIIWGFQFSPHLFSLNNNCIVILTLFFTEYLPIFYKVS